MNLMALMVLTIPLFSQAQDFTQNQAASCHNTEANLYLRPILMSTNEYLNLFSVAGFNKLDSESCKKHADIAKNSVFRMVIPSGDRRPLKVPSGRNPSEFYQNLVKDIQSDTSPPPTTNEINIDLLKACAKNNSPVCEIETNYRTSTVVLTGDGSEGRTVFHNFRATLKEIIKLNKSQGKTPSDALEQLKNYKVPAYLYNYEGKLVASPENLELKITGISLEQIEYAWSNPEDISPPTYLDGASIRLSRSIGKGIPLAKKAPFRGEISTIIGYPGKSNQWSQYGGQDSDGHSIYCTASPTLSLEGAAARTNWPAHLNSPDVFTRLQKDVIYNGASSFGGMSGGAVVNENGELIANHSRGGDMPFNVATSNIKIQELR